MQRRAPTLSFLSRSSIDVRY